MSDTQKKNILNNNMQFTEYINLDNARKATFISYEDYVDKFKAKEWQDNDINDFSSITYYNTLMNWLKKIVNRNKFKYIKKYKYARNQSNGRLYVRDCGIQSMPCLLKCYLLEGIKCTDYDMKNAHFNILYYLCNKHNIKCNILKKYCYNRNEVLKNYKANKLDMIMLLYNDKCPSNKLKDFHRELNNIKYKINNLESHNINKINNNKKNPYSALLSTILCYYENIILQKVINIFDCYIPYYDGFIGEPGINLLKLNALTADYGITWSVKSLENNITLDDLNININEKIHNKYKFYLNASHYEIAKYYCNELLQDKGKYIYYKGKNNAMWFTYDDYNILSYSTLYPTSLIVDLYEKYFNEINNILNDCSENFDILSKQFKIYQKFFIKIKKQIGNVSYQKSLIESLKLCFSNNNIIDKIDNNNNILCFSNCLYDFESEEFREINKEDYIMTHIKYPLPEININIQNDINDIINSIFDIQELNKYFWDSIIFSCFTNKFEKFNIWTGCGSNGKGLLTTLLKNSFSDYLKQPNSSFLTCQKNSVNSSLMQCKGRKLIMVSEPENNALGQLKFNTNFIKKITGGDDITGRALYQDEQTFKNNFNLFCQTNEIPEIESLDNAIRRRFVILPFNNTFVTQEKYDSIEDKTNIKLGNSDLKDKIGTIEYGGQFILMLINRSHGYFNKKLIIPEICKCALNNYIEENDNISEFISECYDIIPTIDIKKYKNKCILRTTDIYNNYLSWSRGTNKYNKKQFKYNLLLIQGLKSKRTSKFRGIQGLKEKVDESEED